jgi:carboxyl-terminal processing protease
MDRYDIPNEPVQTQKRGPIRVSLGVLVICILLTGVIIFSLTCAAVSSYYGRFPGLKKLQEIDSLYEKNYINDIDKDQLSEILVQAYLYGTGDRFTAYYSAEEWAEQEASESGNSVGIGVYVVASETGEIYISKVMEGVGADKAGLLSGDIVISIDGVNVAEVVYESASALLKGEIGSQVTLRIRRGTETFTVDIVRSQYAAQTVFAETVMRGGNLYGLVQITEFLSVQTTFNQFKTAVDALIEYGVQGLIFDVRNNLGGDVNAVLRMLDYLLPEGPLVHLYYADQIDPITRYSDAGHIDLPMVVLVNEYTASSAELFAAALRDYELGVIVGETTYGKGVAQSTYKLESGGAVRLTTAKYYPPSGQGYDGIGVVPHKEVKSDNVNLFLTPHGEDPVYQAALEELTS